MKFINLLLLILSLLFISCDPCQEVDCPNPFTEEELLWLPYSEGDNLVFVNANTHDSLVYEIKTHNEEKLNPTEGFSPHCQTACFYQLRISGERVFLSGNVEWYGFAMDKTISGRRLVKQAGINPEFEFNLNDAVRLDSVSINNKYVKNVYQYTCKPEQNNVAKSYMHQGMGLVKIVFRDGQEFELVEHIKAD